MKPYQEKMLLIDNQWAQDMMIKSKSLEEQSKRN